MPGEHQRGKARTTWTTVGLVRCMGKHEGGSELRLQPTTAQEHGRVMSRDDVTTVNQLVD